MPLDRGCSTDAMSKNISTLVDKDGKPQKQAVAIGYAVLKKACGVTGNEKMTPAQIVARGKKESVQVQFGAPLDEISLSGEAQVGHDGAGSKVIVQFDRRQS